MDLVLGVDGGGTKTAVAFANRHGSVVTLEIRPSVDPTTNPHWPATLEDILADHRDEVNHVSVAAFGLPFHGEVAEYSEGQTQVCEQLLNVPTVVENDVRIAFDGAFPGQAGALILSGTGSMAWASRNGPDDPHIRVGGWGDAFGDEGSAYWIGRETLALVSRELDGRRSGGEFSRALLAEMDIDGDDLIAWCYGLENRRAAFAGLAAKTAHLAEAGDSGARAILERAGNELAETLTTAWRRAAPDSPMRWTCAGGVMASRIVVNRIRQHAGSPPVERRLSPIGGALYRAASHAGWPADDAWLDALAGSLARADATPSAAERSD